MDLLSHLLSALVQGMVAIVLAFIVWLCHRGGAHLLKRPGAHFGSWSGLRRSKLSWPVLWGIWIGAGVIGLLFQLLAAALSDDFAQLSASTPQHQLADGGLALALVGGLAYAVVTTGFSEELLFRGVLARRLRLPLNEGPVQELADLLAR